MKSWTTRTTQRSSRSRRRHERLPCVAGRGPVPPTEVLVAHPMPPAVCLPGRLNSATPKAAALGTAPGARPRARPGALRVDSAGRRQCARGAHSGAGARDQWRSLAPSGESVGVFEPYKSLRILRFSSSFGGTAAGPSTATAANGASAGDAWIGHPSEASKESQDIIDLDFSMPLDMSRLMSYPF